MRSARRSLRSTMARIRYMLINAQVRRGSRRNGSVDFDPQDFDPQDFR